MLNELMGCLAPCFARVEPRRQTRKYITGLISDLPQKLLGAGRAGRRWYAGQDAAAAGACGLGRV